MKTILIDTENISKREEYEFITELKGCKLIFFETKNTKNNKIPLSTAMKLSQSKVKIEFLHVDVTGKNALDFKICALAGKINKWNSEVYILSRDKGYDNLKEFNIHRIESIKNLQSIKTINGYDKILERIKSLRRYKKLESLKTKANLTTDDKVKIIISEKCNKYENDIKFINSIVTEVKRNNKIMINNILQKQLRNSDLVLQKQLYKALINVN